jgi:hypothetical protein
MSSSGGGNQTPKHTRPRSSSTNEDEQPKKKRRQVKRACLNCRIAHSACDEGRPCKRCISHGLQASCLDVARRNGKATSNTNMLDPNVLLSQYTQQSQQSQQQQQIPTNLQALLSQQQQQQQQQQVLPSIAQQLQQNQPINGLGQINQLAQLGLQQGPLLNNPQNAHLFLAQQYIPFLNTLAAQHQTLLNVVQQLQSTNPNATQQQQRVQQNQVNQQLQQQYQQQQLHNPFQVPNQTKDDFPNYLPPYNPNGPSMLNTGNNNVGGNNNIYPQQQQQLQPTHPQLNNIQPNHQQSNFNSIFDTMADEQGRQLQQQQQQQNMYSHYNRSRRQSIPSPSYSSGSSSSGTPPVPSRHNNRLTVPTPLLSSHVLSPSPEPIDFPSTSTFSEQQSLANGDGNDSDEEEVVRYSNIDQLNDFKFNLIDDYFTKLFEDEPTEQPATTTTTASSSTSNENQNLQSTRSEFDLPEPVFFPKNISSSSQNATTTTSSGVMCIAVWRMDGTLYSATDTFLKWFNVSPKQQLVKSSNLNDISSLSDGLVNQETPYSDLLHYSQIFHPGNEKSSFQQDLKQVLSGKSSYYSGAARLCPVSNNKSNNNSRAEQQSSELEQNDISNDKLLDCYVSCYCVENSTQKFYAVSHVSIENSV